MNHFEGWWPPSKQTLVVIALWAAFIVWNGISFFDYVSISNRGTALAANAAWPWIVLNFWGLAAGLFFAANALNVLGWRRRRRMTLGCIAFAIMVGRLFGIGVVATGLFSGSTVASFALMPLALLVNGMLLTIIAFLALSAVFLLVTGFPVLLFLQLQQVDKAIKIFQYREDGLLGFVGRGVRWLRNEAEPETPPDDSKGARFATEKEIARLNVHRDQPQEFAKAMVFGHRSGPLRLANEKHVLIMASTRSGKGVALIIPHLLRYQGSAFVLDPKGENAKATGRHRAQLNDSVHYLDPFGISGKPQSRFNPISRFTPENMEAESKALAAATFVNKQKGEDSHWMASGQQLLATVILFVYLSPKVAAADKDMPMVRKILLGSLKPALKEMTLMDDADGLLRDLAVSFIETPEKEFGSILSTAQRQTEIFDNPYIAACLKATGDAPAVDFDQWHTGTMTVYLCLAAPRFPVFNRWLRLILTSALDGMTDMLDPPALPVCFMLDELATLGHLETVENAVGLAAGYGIQLVTVFQDVAQMRDLYKGRWASFISNAGVRAVFNLDDYDTARYWSQFVGNYVAESNSVKRDVYGFNDETTVNDNVRALIPTDLIMMDYASERMLILDQGQHPFSTQRVAYFDDPELRGMWDDPRVKVARRPALPRSQPIAMRAKVSNATPVPARVPPAPVAPAPAAPQPASAAPSAAQADQPPLRSDGARKLTLAGRKSWAETVQSRKSWTATAQPLPVESKPGEEGEREYDPAFRDVFKSFEKMQREKDNGDYERD